MKVGTRNFHLVLVTLFNNLAHIFFQSNIYLTNKSTLPYQMLACTQIVGQVQRSLLHFISDRFGNLEHIRAQF